MTIQEFADAVQAQVAAAAGLPGSKVIWEGPNIPRPARPFLALSIQEDGDEEPLPEEDMLDNPSPTPGVASSADLSTMFGGIFTAGSRATALDVTGVTYQLTLETFTVSPTLASALVPASGNTPATLVIYCGNVGAFNGTAVINFINSDPLISSYISAVGSGSVPITVGTSIFINGGYPSQDPLLLETTDRTEITVRVTAFTDAPKTGAISPAFALLKQVRRKMGSELVADALDPITVLDRGNVTNVTVVLETGYEGRAALDLKFGSIETESEGINTIETVQIEVTTKDLDGSTISDKTITLPNS